MKNAKKILACFLIVLMVMCCLPLSAISAEVTLTDLNVDTNNIRKNLVIDVVNSPLDSSEKVIEVQPYYGNNAGFGVLRDGQEFTFEQGKRYALVFEYYYPITDPAGVDLEINFYRTTATGATANGNKTSIPVAYAAIKPTDSWVRCRVDINADWTDNLNQNHLALLTYFTRGEVCNNIYYRNISILTEEEACGIDFENKRGNVTVENHPADNARRAVKLQVNSNDRLCYGLRDYEAPYTLEDGKSYTVKFKYYYYTGQANSTSGDIYLYRTTSTGATDVGNKTGLLGSSVKLISIDKMQEYEYTFTVDLSTNPTQNRLALSTYINEVEQPIMSDGIFFTDITLQEALPFNGVNVNNANATISVEKLPNMDKEAVQIITKQNQRQGFGVIKDGKPLVLEHGRTYKVLFDYYITANGIKDIQMYRTTETGGNGVGNKTPVNMAKDLDTSIGWHSASYTFQVDLTAEPNQKYLWISSYSTNNENAFYIKNINVLVDSESFGISLENIRNQEPVPVVANPTNSSELVLSPKINYNDRRAYGLVDKNGEPIAIQEGHVYSIKYDYYYHQTLASNQVATDGDIWFFRSTATGCISTGNKTGVVGHDITNTSGWVSIELTFRAAFENSPEQTYLALTTMADYNRSSTEFYIKNLVVADVTMPDNVKSISLDTANTKTEYQINEGLRDEDITVKVTYSDDSTDTIGADMLTVYGFDTVYPGERQLIVNYGAGNAQLTVNVMTPAITISSPSLNLKVGETHKLTATTTPSGQGVTWESLNPGVAAVFPNGEVRAFAPGTAEIRALIIRNGVEYVSSCMVTVPGVNTGSSDAKIVLGSGVASSLAYIKVPIMVENSGAISTLGISNLQFDNTKLEFVSAEWTIDTPILADWDNEAGQGVAVFSGNTVVNGEVMVLTFRSLDNYASYDTEISCDVTAKSSGTTSDTSVTFGIVPSELNVKFIRGDLDNNSKLDSDDAVYLLYCVMFGTDTYPLNQQCDFNGDNCVSEDDAVYLLYHTLFGNMYPLTENADTPNVSVPDIPEDDKDNGFNDWIPLK